MEILHPFVLSRDCSKCAQVVCEDKVFFKVTEHTREGNEDGKKIVPFLFLLQWKKFYEAIKKNKIQTRCESLSIEAHFVRLFR